jgi:arylsulfatase A-like enzyme
LYLFIDILREGVILKVDSNMVMKNVCENRRSIFLTYISFMRLFLYYATVVGLFVLIGCAEVVEKPKQPNILIIYADDMGYGDASCYNPASKIETKHIDQLAREGMLFTDAHAAASVCTPSRYALLTGRYPFRSDLSKGVLWTYARPLIDRKQPTLANMLKQAGYQTGIVGKWHLGFNWPTDKPVSDERWQEMDELEKEALIDFRKSLRDGPNKLGFDYFFGMDTPNFPPYAFLENGFIVGELPTRADTFEIKGGVAGVQQRDWKNKNILPTLCDKSLEYIEKSAASGKPFFLLMTLTAPHTPIEPNLSFVGKSGAGDYGDLVLEVDDIVGRVVSQLKRLDIDDNTLVVFTSDNGSPGHFAQDSGFGTMYEKYGHESNGPLRGLKGDSWEGGHRVPFIVRWPGKIGGQQTSDRLICQTDLVATIADLTGEPMDIGLGTDSHNLGSILFGTGGEFSRRSVVHQSSSGDLSIRQDAWKLILGKGSGGITAWIDPEDGKGPYDGQLYNLEVDLGEQDNLYGQAKYQSKISELKDLLKEIRNRDKQPDF